MVLQLEVPVLLNQLYMPVVNKLTGKARLVKSKEAKKYTEYVHMECLRQKVKKINSKTISFKMDILIKDRREYDIDAVQKLLFDSLEGVAYENDKHIVELIVRKHVGVERDGLNISIKELS